MATATPVLAQSLTSAYGGSSLVKNIGLAVLGSLAIWLSAKIQIPFYPVPMTMQVFVILAIGAAFGSRLGLATVLLYLAEGAAGLPVFAGTPEKGIGLAYMVGPTGGFLIGFAIMAYIAGFLAERGWDRNVLTMALAMLIGVVALYAVGLTWLAAPFLPLGEFGGIGWEKSIQFGLLPFWIGDLAKIALAALLFPMIWKWIGNR
ncbi:MAG: biotin transporter BioY [Pseudomonadota bacterium]